MSVFAKGEACCTQEIQRFWIEKGAREWLVSDMLFMAESAVIDVAQLAALDSLGFSGVFLPCVRTGSRVGQ